MDGAYRNWLCGMRLVDVWLHSLDISLMLTLLFIWRPACRASFLIAIHKGWDNIELECDCATWCIYQTFLFFKFMRIYYKDRDNCLIM